MRRNALAVVLFALALGLKVLLPGAAAVGASHNGPQTAFQDCLSAAADDALGHAQAPGKADRHAASCPLCQISCEGALAILERAPQPATLEFKPRAPWRGVNGVEPRAREAVAHQARAPPRFS